VQNLVFEFFPIDPIAFQLENIQVYFSEYFCAAQILHFACKTPNVLKVFQGHFTSKKNIPIDCSCTTPNSPDYPIHVQNIVFSRFPKGISQLYK
jgi:hypothetical protein